MLDKNSLFSTAFIFLFSVLLLFILSSHLFRGPRPLSTLIPGI